MKKAIVIAAFLVGSTMVRAEGANEYQYLYWQVAADKVDGKVADYNTAYFCLENGDVISAYQWSSTQTAGSRVNSERVGTADLSSYSGQSFYMELAYWDGTSDKVVGNSATYTFAQLEQYMTSFAPGTSGIPTQNVFSPYISVPEPTSGLLMLLGIAGLALRRKRA